MEAASEVVKPGRISRLFRYSKYTEPLFTACAAHSNNYLWVQHGNRLMLNLWK